MRLFHRASQPTSTVYLIDDNDTLRETMCELIEQDGHKVVAFASAEEFLGADHSDGNACLVVDACLPGLSGVALLRRLKIERRNLPPIVITGYGNVLMAVEAMKIGAVDFLEKPIAAAELLASISRALIFVERSEPSSDQREMAVGLIGDLTARQREIMSFVVAGHSNKVIAADMNVSQRTVETHRAAVMKKTGSKSLSDLIRLALAASGVPA
jgi:two-component system CheB/CheR fusion protein